MNYLAIVDEPNIAVVYHTISGVIFKLIQVSNISSGSGVRSVTNNYNKTFPSTSITSLEYLTSYLLESSTRFVIHIESSATSTTYQTVVWTDSDSHLSRVAFYILFVGVQAM